MCTGMCTTPSMDRSCGCALFSLTTVWKGLSLRTRYWHTLGHHNTVLTKPEAPFLKQDVAKRCHTHRQEDMSQILFFFKILWLNKSTISTQNVFNSSKSISLQQCQALYRALLKYECNCFNWEFIMSDTVFKSTAFMEFYIFDSYIVGPSCNITALICFSSATYPATIFPHYVNHTITQPQTRWHWNHGDRSNWNLKSLFIHCILLFAATSKRLL